jgi:predicted phosphodiesterase
MRIAFFSDIHGNLPALEAALEDAKARGARHLICLGDIVGYGPQPVECLKKIRDIASANVIGNHDAAVCGLFDKERFNTFARETAERVELALSEDDRAWLRGLPYQIEGNGFFCTHGSFNEPEAFDYLSEREDAALSFALYPEVSLFFVGHTHIPCVFVEDGQADGLPRKLPPEDLSLHEGLRYIINPGTIGFPRGDQLTADYVLFDTVTRRISFHCVEYDMAPYRLALVNNGYNLLNYWFLSPKASRFCT